MTVIRFNVDEVFSTDSSEYDILQEAVAAVGETPGAVVEIGTRRGGSAKMIIDVLHSHGNSNRSMFCIDPYGNIELECTNKNISIHMPWQGIDETGEALSTEHTKTVRLDYTNDMRNRVIPSLYYYAYASGLNFQFFCLEDHEFFNRFADGVPVYDYNKVLENNYAFVFFDGPHTNEAVEMELNFFLDRSSVGSVFVFDDIWMYDHDKFEKIMFDAGFETLRKGDIKASYRKISS
jgi:hypothetical protein